MDVAIKIQLEKREETQKGKIFEEYYMMKNINHQNSLRTYGLVKYGSRIGIVIEYCKNKSISDYFKENEILDSAN